MTVSASLPAEVRPLFPAEAARHLALATSLPAGRLIGSDEGDDATPVMWMSDGPAPAGLWEALHRERQHSGLRPLLLAPLHDDREFRPWLSQELYPREMSSPAEHDAATLLRAAWEDVAVCRTDDPDEAEQRSAITAPFGPSWPGQTPAPGSAVDADAHARAYAARLLRGRPALRIGLVPADNGAAALAACGWSGPANHEKDIGRIAAVIGSWGQRFGAQVVCAGFDTLWLSIADPPTGVDEAHLAAAEHLAVCPDNILQGVGSLAVYAESLVGADSWTLWWD
ncbi:DUF4253 domain-containing protein [Kitasatospora sp. KL5]|uniref:DUF4253 domain-containing protein n=1 Tax=Kitasatospora sp. KL5 TaxID=3425125 RepID=UPI003D6E7591